MSFWHYKRSAASVKLLVEFGERRGLTATKLLARTGLKEADLVDATVELDARQELVVVENLVKAHKQAGLGLEVGLCYNFASYGFWGLGLMSSATARDALTLALRFTPLTFAFCDITSQLDGGVCSVRFTEPDVEPDVRQFLLERDMAAASRLMRETLGEAFGLSGFTLKHGHRPDPALLSAVQRQTGVGLVFGADANSLSFDSRMLDLRLPQANPITVAMCERACQDLLERRRARLNTQAWVRQYLEVVPLHTMPTLPQAAQAMCISDRTLKRRLQDEGTSFRSLMAEVRGRQAQELLADASLSLTDIASRMGFSDLSSFSQAFKRWFGDAPSVVRNRGASQTDSTRT